MLSKLKIKTFRNLSSAQILPNKKFNFLMGANGSGKTSILEALYVLGYGRSFRCSNLEAAIQYHQNSLLSCVQLSSPSRAPFYLGLSKEKQKRVQVKLSGQKIRSLSELSSQAPMLFISPESFALLAQGPSVRRQFIDWGTFHSEPGFSEAWQEFSKIFKQRNASLKLGRVSELAAWDKEWVKCSLKITEYRRAYLKRFMPCFSQALSELAPLEGLRIDFWQGWSELEPLEDIILKHRPHELRSGHALVGPQRADLQICLYDYPAHQLLSRGQQKMLVCALYLAQGKLLTETLKKDVIYLIDDLSSELDQHHRTLFLEHIHRMGVQSFITGIEKSLILPLAHEFPSNAYEVVKGEVSQIS